MNVFYFLSHFCLSNTKKAKMLLKSYIKEGMQVGKDVHFFTTIIVGEPFLVKIGEHSTIANNVAFITHDASIGALSDRHKYSDLVGYISIGSHCFVGHNSTILYGVSIPDNTIVAAGSVVTKSFHQSNIIIGGNPACIIGSSSDFIQKHKDQFLSLHGLGKEERKDIIINSGKMIQK